MPRSGYFGGSAGTPVAEKLSRTDALMPKTTSLIQINIHLYDAAFR
jgi:hypothetical protein